MTSSSRTLSYGWEEFWRHSEKRLSPKDRLFFDDSPSFKADGRTSRFTFVMRDLCEEILRAWLDDWLPLLAIDQIGRQLGATHPRKQLSRLNGRSSS